MLNGPEDAEELQRTLDSLCEWARTWGMAFNVEKCHVMHLGLNKLKQPEAGVPDEWQQTEHN